MLQVCKVCNVSKPLDAFLVRRWKTPSGVAREGHRKRCKACDAIHDKKRWNDPANPRKATRAAYRKKHAAKLAAYRAAYYGRNRDRWLNPETGWRFTERAKAYDRSYSKDPINAARKKEYEREWRVNNRPRLLLKTLGRLEKVRLATPQWVTRDMLLPFYEASKRMEHLTGIKHHVDHYYPLVSDVVCGLHVPANLRVIPAFDNLSKANRLPE